MSQDENLVEVKFNFIATEIVDICVDMAEDQKLNDSVTISTPFGSLRGHLSATFLLFAVIILLTVLGVWFLLK